ncbi:hypothetical protein [Orenia marismortui]|uniref:Uncharacterized protein n=1 Tax=Orenia marismortui TaxID=46469 RepID=A0A4V3GXM1_9FIRM|nr:hypothetical protein [Orenia marismortui]TDX48295.1 hypothetical protein C7959_13022 [Orenia marismortui]
MNNLDLDKIETGEWNLSKVDLNFLSKSIGAIPKDKELSPKEAYLYGMMTARLLDRLSEIHAKIEYYYLNKEVDRKDIYAVVSSEESTVAAGKRKADKDETVKLAKKEENKAKAFLSLIENKIKAIEKIHYMCKAKFEKEEKEASRNNMT